MEKTRQNAINAKERHYYTGKPCKRGHTAKRNTADGCCVECRAESSARQAEQAKDIRAMLNEASNS